MTEHLRKEGLTIYCAIHIISASRASLEDKVAALRLVSSKLTEIKNTFDEREQEQADKLERLIKVADFALMQTKENNPPGTVFLLGSFILGEMDDATDDFDGDVPFITFEAAKSRLLKESKLYYEKYQEDWDWKRYTISKWIPAPNGEMLNILTWYLSNEGVIWFVGINKDFDENLKQLAEDGYDLNINSRFQSLLWFTIPFEPGDIVTIDCRPSHMEYNAVIAEIGGRDSCGTQAIYFTEGGELMQLSLNLVSQCRHWPPLFSCLYRLEKFSGELSPWEAPLKKVSEILKRDPTIGISNGEGDFLSRTRFTESLRNFLPDPIDVGDVIRIVPLCSDCGATGLDRYVVIVDLDCDTDDVMVISCRNLEQRFLYKTMLKHELGTITHYYFVKCTDELSDRDPLKAMGEELKRDPSLADDEEFIRSVCDKLNKLAIDVEDKYKC